MTDPRPVLRFAPSPNGDLHLGHAFSALFTQAMVQQLGGRFLLRIENTDLTRYRPEFEEHILEDLAWLGIEWETPVRRQSDHFPDYAVTLERLRALGLLYPCFASRREIAEAADRAEPPLRRDPDGSPLYPGLYRGVDPVRAAERIAAGEPYALRLDMKKALALALRRTGAPLAFESFDEEQRAARVEVYPARWGDVVLSGKDRPATYHLAVVTDDARQGVTHVTRGMDLYAATDIHRLLQVLLGLPAPLYCHHRLIVDASGRKLAKSQGDKSLRALRAEGMSAADIKRRLGFDER
jgi:glutamyl-Q tRNA(Asp) synthetase